MDDEHVTRISIREAVRFVGRGLLPALLLAAAAAGLAYLMSRSAEPVYRSSAILLATRPSAGYTNAANVIQPAQVDPAIYRSALLHAGLLETALTNVLGARPSIDETDAWRRHIRIRVDENLISSLVHIEVDDADPKIAAGVANALVDALLAWERDRVSRTIQATARSLDRSILLLGAQLAAAEQRGDDATAQVLRTSRDRLLAELSAAETLSLSAVVIGLLEPFREAVVASKPVNNRAAFYAAVAFVIFFILSYTLQLFLRLTDYRLRSAEDLERATGFEPLATIPPASRNRADFEAAIGRVCVNLLLAQATPGSVQDRASAGQGRSLLITSATSASERGLLAFHLASAYARAGRKTLLIDGDLRTASLTLALPEFRGPTLTSLLQASENTTPEAITDEIGPSLTVVRSRRIAQDASLPFLGVDFSNAMKTWRSKYEIVIIDSTAVAEAASALSIASEVDNVLLVAKAGSTNLIAIRQAIRKLSREGFASIDVVMTSAERTGRRTQRISTSSSTSSYGTAYKEAPTFRPGARAVVVERPKHRN